MNQTTRLRLLDSVARWLPPVGVTFGVPGWFLDLLSGVLPKIPQPRRQLLAAAAICGTTKAPECSIGQVSYDLERCASVTAKFATAEEAAHLETFARALYLTQPASAVRTAVMLGFAVPGAQRGVISQTRHVPVSVDEVQRIFQQATEVLHGRRDYRKTR